MPRSPIVGRFCHNPACRRAIGPHRKQGTLYCDSSCRAEAAREAAEKAKAHEESGETVEALRRAAGKSQRPHRPRTPTPYVVMKANGGALIPAAYEIVGFASDTNKRRAIRKCLGADAADGSYVAVPLATLKLHDLEGDPLSEAEPEWHV